MMRLVLLFVFTILVPNAALSVEPDEILTDATLEARARALSKELRCVVCQNQDIDSSNAGVARDLRILVRERLQKGDSDDEVLAYIQARYGDFVLLKPPFKPSTYALWLAPPALILVSVFFGLGVMSRNRKQNIGVDLTEREELQVSRLIDAEKSRGAS